MRLYFLTHVYRSPRGKARQHHTRLSVHIHSCYSTGLLLLCRRLMAFLRHKLRVQRTRSAAASIRAHNYKQAARDCCYHKIRCDMIYDMYVSIAGRLSSALAKERGTCEGNAEQTNKLTLDYRSPGGIHSLVKPGTDQVGA